jgi:hypothetical protein
MVSMCEAIMVCLVSLTQLKAFSMTVTCVGRSDVTRTSPPTQAGDPGRPTKPKAHATVLATPGLVF